MLVSWNMFRFWAVGDSEYNTLTTSETTSQAQIFFCLKKPGYIKAVFIIVMDNDVLVTVSVVM